MLFQISKKKKNKAHLATQVFCVFQSSHASVRGTYNTSLCSLPITWIRKLILHHICSLACIHLCVLEYLFTVYKQHIGEEHDFLQLCILMVDLPHSLYHDIYEKCSSFVSLLNDDRLMGTWVLSQAITWRPSTRSHHTPPMWISLWNWNFIYPLRCS